MKEKERERESAVVISCHSKLIQPTGSSTFLEKCLIPRSTCPTGIEGLLPQLHYLRPCSYLRPYQSPPASIAFRGLKPFLKEDPTFLSMRYSSIPPIKDRSNVGANRLALYRGVGFLCWSLFQDTKDTTN